MLNGNTYSYSVVESAEVDVVSLPELKTGDLILWGRNLARIDGFIVEPRARFTRIEVSVLNADTASGEMKMTVGPFNSYYRVKSHKMRVESFNVSDIYEDDADDAAGGVKGGDTDKR